MSELLGWLGYLASGAFAFVAAYRWHWRISLAMIAGALIGTPIAMLGFATAAADERSPWLQVELALNGSISLIFAAAGAAIALALRHSRG